MVSFKSVTIRARYWWLQRIGVKEDILVAFDRESVGYNFQDID